MIIFSSIPELGLNVPTLAVKKRWFGGYANDLCITADKYNQRQKEAKEVLRDLEKHGLAKVIWVDSVFFSQNGNMRPLIENGKSLYIDDDHLSTTGANILIQGVKKELLESMELRKDPKGE
ncbi:MAG: SGNH hydrolase domain-containing protein [Akkermansia sp.]|nr:SGNH hydrolase domain-containing protein [Akkermansia sp.]